MICRSRAFSGENIFGDNGFGRFVDRYSIAMSYLSGPKPESS